MILLQWPPLNHQSLICNAQYGGNFSSLSSANALWSSAFKSKINSKLTSKFRCFCKENDTVQQVSVQGFSALPEDVPWDSDNVWSTMALYIFSLHIPLSFGSVSLVARLLDEPDLHPQTKAVSVLAAQVLEFIGALALLKLTAKPEYRYRILERPKKSPSKRNWLFTAAIGFGFLLMLVFSTSIVSDRLFGPKDVNDPVLKEILLSSDVSKVACIFMYCIIAPLLEETVYRGFLLTSMASKMKWQYAVLISSAVFSGSHLSVDNSLQLFLIGCVLGCSYCWSDGELGHPCPEWVADDHLECRCLFFEEGKKPWLRISNYKHSQFTTEGNKQEEVDLLGYYAVQRAIFDGEI